MALDANKAVVRRRFAAVINLGRLDALLTTGDTVVARFTARGTHAPTGHAVDDTGIDISRLAVGTIVVRRGSVDMATLPR